MCNSVHVEDKCGDMHWDDDGWLIVVYRENVFEEKSIEERNGKTPLMHIDKEMWNWHSMMD